MAEKPYEWVDGAILEDHSRRKHKILREYFFKYLTVRCQLPQMEKFRLAIVDGFAGGGRYKCGAPGSPLIFIEELRRAVELVNTHRTSEGLGLIEVECLLVLNDFSKDALETLKTNIAPLQADITENVPRLHLRIEYLNQAFEDAYPVMKQFLEQGRFRNVLFNLDQCGHSKVSRATLIDIMHSYRSDSRHRFDMIETILNMDPTALKGLEVRTRKWRAGAGKSDLMMIRSEIGKRTFALVVSLSKEIFVSEEFWHMNAKD